MAIHPGQGLLMLLFVDDGWVLSSPPWGPSKWELSITVQEAVTTSAIPVLRLNWELRAGGQGLSLWLFFCPITYTSTSVSSLFSWIGRLLCFVIFWSLSPTERDVWLQGMCLTSGDQLGLFSVPSGASLFLYPEITLPCLISVTACPLYRICYLLHLKEIIFSY